MKMVENFPVVRLIRVGYNQWSRSMLNGLHFFVLLTRVWPYTNFEMRDFQTTTFIPEQNVQIIFYIEELNWTMIYICNSELNLVHELEVLNLTSIRIIIGTHFLFFCWDINVSYGSGKK